MKKFILLLILFYTLTLNAQKIGVLKDIQPGNASSFPSQLVLINDKLYFAAADADHGSELWSSTVKKNGTKLILDLNPGIAGSNPSNITLFNNALYFSANDGITGYELWKADQDGSNPVRLTNSIVGSAIDISAGFIVFQNHLYFSYNDGVHGSELWSTDGTNAGTKLVKDIMPNSMSTQPSKFFIFNNKLFFKGLAPIDTQALYATDGTTIGTDSVYNCGEGGCNGFTVFNNALYFISDDQIFSNLNDELYISDGTKAGTRILKDLKSNGSGAVGYLVNSGNQLFFAGDDGQHGTELWKSNGTATGTVQVKDITPGAVGSNISDIIPYNNNKVVFEAHVQGGNGTVWISDGLSNNTIMLDTLILDPGDKFRNVALLGQKLLFSGYKDGIGYELCSTDGTAPTTGVALDIFKGAGSSFPSFFTLKNDTLFLIANDEKKGYEVYGVIFNGTSAQKIELQNEAIAKTKLQEIEQNTPNPAATLTTIGYQLPLKYNRAAIAVINSYGRTVNWISLSGTGHNSLQLNVTDLKPGLYYYSLIIDGKTIGTKKMICL